MLFLVAPGFAGEVGCARGGTGADKKSPALVASQDRAPSCFVLENETEEFKMQLSQRGLQRGDFRFHPKGLKSSKLLMKQAVFFFSPNGSCWCPSRQLACCQPWVLAPIPAGHVCGSQPTSPSSPLGKNGFFSTLSKARPSPACQMFLLFFFLIPFPSLCMCVLK